MGTMPSQCLIVAESDTNVVSRLHARRMKTREGDLELRLGWNEHKAKEQRREHDREANRAAVDGAAADTKQRA